MHLIVLEERIGVFKLHDGRLEDRLAVFDLAHVQIRLVKLGEKFTIAGACLVRVHFSLEQRSAYLDTFDYFWIVTKSWLLLDLDRLWLHLIFRITLLLQMRRIDWLDRSCLFRILLFCRIIIILLSFLL